MKAYKPLQTQQEHRFKVVERSFKNYVDNNLMLESLDIFHNAKILNETWKQLWKMMSLIRMRNLNLSLNVMMSE